MTQNGSETYRWILDNTEYMLETPDEAFDWVFMLTDNDWQLLVAHWDERAVHAKEALAYIVCEGPSRQSRDMLLRALRDQDRHVVAQAAESLKSQRELDGEDFLPLDVQSDELIRAYLKDGEWS
ncbi:hypothetical protein DTL21_13960 [Bremerella cremea]|uniref:HEAT repeat domain-containing protein n=1 Tax=Blastopirellula marina TaxID=124 RepID=A0A2S8FR00_9BACT|nr:MULTISPECIES: hypothetical protein [Pirellulaceae]PQO34611.1 hypothetical protein C5Y83_13955 [Blastopirellula marina]RCS47108.1 hypothetical protein DTL21_13960 [Bremerella cremea]